MSKANKQTTGTVSFKKKDEAVEIEPETPISTAVSQPSSYDFDDIVGEKSIADAGGYCRVKIVQGTSAEAGQIPLGDFALIDPAGEPHDLGKSIDAAVLRLLKYWLKDYDPSQSTGYPVRFETEEEVWHYGGSTAFQPEPGKVKFSRAADLWLCLPASAKLPQGIPAASIAGRPFIPALLTLSRTAFRRAGTALLNHAKFSGESLCERTFRFETKQEVQRGGTNRYYVPILRHLGDEGAQYAASRPRIQAALRGDSRGHSPGYPAGSITFNSREKARASSIRAAPFFIKSLKMTTDQSAIDHSALPPIVRLELLVGLLSDQLMPARELVAQLKLLANASHVTKSDLALLLEFTGSIWERLGQLTEEIQALRREL